MEPISIGAAILIVIQNIPVVIDLVKQLAGLVTTIKANAEKAAFISSFLVAYKKAVETGNTQDLEDIFGGHKK